MFEKMGERIKKRRMELGLSLAAVSELSGISKSSLQRYEIDPSKMKRAQIADLAKALNVNPTWILGLQSKDISPKDSELITPLLNEIGFTLDYDFEDDNCKLINQTSNNSVILTKEDLEKLKSEILSFVGFQVSKLFHE